MHVICNCRPVVNHTAAKNGSELNVQSESNYKGKSAFSSDNLSRSSITSFSTSHLHYDQNGGLGGGEVECFLVRSNFCPFSELQTVPLGLGSRGQITCCTLFPFQYLSPSPHASLAHLDKQVKLGLSKPQGEF